MPTSRVTSVTAVLNEPTTFVLKVQDEGYTAAVSSSPLIQRLLLTAFLTEADVAVDLVPDSVVIKRINAFAAGSGLNLFPDNEYYVSRVATQRNLGVRDEHLEVFLVKGNRRRRGGAPPEDAYNVYDQSLQLVLEAAFSRPAPTTRVRLHVEFEDKQIVTVRMGEPFDGYSLAADRPIADR